MRTQHEPDFWVCFVTKNPKFGGKTNFFYTNLSLKCSRRCDCDDPKDKLSCPTMSKKIQNVSKFAILFCVWIDYSQFIQKLLALQIIYCTSIYFYFQPSVIVRLQRRQRAFKACTKILLLKHSGHRTIDGKSWALKTYIHAPRFNEM